MKTTPVSFLLYRKGSKVFSVGPSATIAEAVAEMNTYRIGSVLVMDNDTLYGIFTERDVLTRVVGRSIDVQTAKVSTVMTVNPQTIRPSATVDDVMQIYSDKHCRHLPVIENGHLLGMLSIGDVNRWIVDYHEAECIQLKTYITGMVSH
jgi:CBS domain-containing protein